MAHKYALILLGGTGTAVKQIQFTRHKVIGFGLCLILSLISMGYGVVDYFSLRKDLNVQESLRRKFDSQTEEVIHQREQIQEFAREINAFKEKLIQLDKFKQNIRIVADIDKTNNGKGLFGIGGSPPEDLKFKLDLSQRHQRLIKDMHQQIGQLNYATTVQHNDLEALLEKLKSQKNLLAHTPAISPAKGWISSKFGYRRSPFTGKREFHKGLDIANRKGSPVIATADGVVSNAGQKGLLGKVVIIDHGHGVVTRYAHLDKILSTKGDKVKRGVQIGKMGNSGRSTGPHLHYEVRLNGVPVNPVKYILKK